MLEYSCMRALRVRKGFRKPSAQKREVSAALLRYMGCGGSVEVRPDAWQDDPPGFSAEGGNWQKFMDLDMSGQGDVEVKLLCTKLLRILLAPLITRLLM